VPFYNSHSSVDLIVIILLSTQHEVAALLSGHGHDAHIYIF